MLTFVIQNTPVWIIDRRGTIRVDKARSIFYRIRRLVNLVAKDRYR